MSRTKGSLNLSINAIVVIILAITMLGLGLNFMRTTFGGVTDQFQQVSDEMKKTMIDQLKDSGESVALNTYELELKPGEDKVVYLAMKNDRPEPRYLIPGGFNDPAFCNEIDYSGAGPKDCETFQFSREPFVTAQPNSVEVIPVTITVPGIINKDTFTFTIEACSSTTSATWQADCPTPTFDGSIGSYDFFITVK